MSEKKNKKVVLQERMTLKGLGLAKPLLIETVSHDQKSEIDIAFLYGTITAMVKKPKIGLDGEPTEVTTFEGSFRGVNAITGDEYASARLIFPKVLESIMAAATATKSGDAIQFAYAITAKYDEKAPATYRFGAYSLIECNDDAMKELAGAVREKLNVLR